MEDTTEKGPNFEQLKWEEEHMNAALLQFGAKDAKKKHQKKEEAYEYVMDDEIEFVQALQMPGTKDKEKDVSKPCIAKSDSWPLYTIVYFGWSPDILT